MSAAGACRAYARLAVLYWPLTVVVGFWASLLLALGFGLGWLAFG
ncbi:MAG TPA: hypothetical protein VJ890_14545 [Vineibacter sp.]|nr:hypothetical protein [Vineibacter sp.]